MPVSYENFRGEMYHLHSKLTKKGNTTYHFSKKEEGAISINTIPDLYEIYENPNGKVYLRKKMKPLIIEEEVKIVEEGMEKNCEIEDFKLDIKKNFIYIYTLDNEMKNRVIPEQFINKYKQYETQMRFVLIDQDERIFEVERFSYKGSINDWIYLEGSTDLEELVRKYTQHLGRESFYELG